jgi:hypothetical protein
VQGGCCGGLTSFLVNTYFGENPTSLFDWDLTHVEAKYAISSTLFLTMLVELDNEGLDHFGFGFEIGW